MYKHKTQRQRSLGAVSNELLKTIICKAWQTSKSTTGASECANYYCVSDSPWAIIKGYNNIGGINLDIPADTCSTVADWAELVLTLQHASSSCWWCVGHNSLQGISSSSVVCKSSQFLNCNSTPILGCCKITRTREFGWQLFPERKK